MVTTGVLNGRLARKAVMVPCDELAPMTIWLNARGVMADYVVKSRESTVGVLKSPVIGPIFRGPPGCEPNK